MEKSNRTVLLVVLVAFVALVAYGLGAATTYFTRSALPDVTAQQPSGDNSGNGAGQPDPQIGRPDNVPRELEEAFDPFWKTFEAVNSEYYYRPVDPQQMIYGAAKGMVDSLGDPYSAFLTPQENQSVQSRLQGNFEGVGMWFEKRDDLPTVVAPIPNTPAERAGIRAKDNILAVDGRDITQLSTDQIASLIRGPAGTKVRLTMRRGDEIFDVELTRARIEVPSVTLKMLDGNIAHIEANVFGDRTTDELDQALTEALANNAKGIILDLRNNGGGYVVAAQAMLGRFLTEDKVAFYESRKADGSQDTPKMVIGGGPDAPNALDIPLVVLVNGGSASASELVAGALQDYERATLIGEQTFGKGTEQHAYVWDDGSSARITFAHWLTPNKRNINPQPTPTPDPRGTPPPLPTFTPVPSETLPPADATATAGARPLVPTLTDRGLTPDIVVVRTEKDYQEDKDPQLDRAAEFLKKGR